MTLVNRPGLGWRGIPSPAYLGFLLVAKQNVRLEYFLLPELVGFLPLPQVPDLDFALRASSDDSVKFNGIVHAHDPASVGVSVSGVRHVLASVEVGPDAADAVPPQQPPVLASGEDGLAVRHYALAHSLNTIGVPVKDSVGGARVVLPNHDLPGWGDAGHDVRVETGARAKEFG